MTKLAVTSKCATVAGHFNSHGGATEQYRRHHLIQHDQGHTKCPWTPPSGNYLLHIAPAAARATANKQQSKNTPTLLAILMTIAMRRYDAAHIAQWRRSRASLEATGCHHQATCSDSINRTCQHRFLPMFFIVKLSKKATKHKDSP
jgi:hypothetical protein